MESETQLATFFSMFVLVYLFGYFVVFRKWGPKHVAEASSCLVSLAHGTPVVFMALRSLVATSSSSTPLVSPNTGDQNSVLDYSMAYFALDLIHYALFFPGDLLFILHHLATLYVFATCRFAVGRGAFGLLVLLVLAEATSACQNAWTLAGLASTARGSHAAAKARDFLAPRFYALYSVFRVALGPAFAAKMGFAFAGSDVIPTWAWVSWMVVISTAILVSVLWVSVHWVQWFQDKRIKELKKNVN